MSAKECMEISSNLIISPELKGSDGKDFQYKIPDIVLQQPNDWEFNMFKNNVLFRTFKYSNLSKSFDEYTYCYIKGEFLTVNSNMFFKKQYTIQYQMVRVQTTIQEKTPLEKLTEKVEQLTAELNELKNK